MKRKFKLISFQSFSIYAAGGGSRILRRLYEGHENNIISVCVTNSISTIIDARPIEEIEILKLPTQKKWMRSFLRTFIFWLQNVVFFSITIKRLTRVLRNIDADIIHLVDHEKYSSAILQNQQLLENKQLWVSFHDFYSTSGSTFNISSKLWQIADRRLVISDEMGKIYQELFGKRSYEIITDGLLENEISTPANVVFSKPISLYFAGLLHIGYIDLFKVLADALDDLSDNYQFELVLRGTQKLDFLINRRFKVDFRPLTLDSITLFSELNSANILYLPIKYTPKEFYLYSLSTKMIGYLGASGTILYHGPSTSAANKLLSTKSCAISCTTLDVEDLKRVLTTCLVDNNSVIVSQNAKKLAKDSYLLKNIQSRFWLN